MEGTEVDAQLISVPGDHRDVAEVFTQHEMCRNRPRLNWSDTSGRCRRTLLSL